MECIFLLDRMIFVLNTEVSVHLGQIKMFQDPFKKKNPMLGNINRYRFFVELFGNIFYIVTIETYSKEILALGASDDYLRKK